MATKVLTPRMGRWVIRACVLACGAVWWLLAQSTGAFAGEGSGVPDTPALGSPVGATTDAVADVTDTTTKQATGAVRHLAQQPVAERVLPRVTGPTLIAAADDVDATAERVDDTVKAAGVTLDGVASAGLQAAPDAPVEQAPATTPATAPTQTMAHAAGSSAEGQHRDGPAMAAGDSRGQRKLRPGHGPGAAIGTPVQLTAHHASPVRQPSAVTAEQPGPDGRPATPPLGLADDAGQTAQGGGASGGAVSTLASAALTPPLRDAGLSVPTSWAIPTTRAERPDSTPD